MYLESKVTGKQYEVKTYAMEDGTRGICHESLQSILENELAVSYNVEALAATETYCAAKCTITDEAGRKVQGFNDVNTNLLEGRDGPQEKFAKAHPLISAVQAAVDTAVRAYLKWPRSLETEAPERVSVVADEPNIPDDVLAAEEAAAETPDTEALDGAMNPPEDEAPFNGDEVVEPETAEEGDDPVRARLAELGKKYPPSNSKYGKSTYDEIWENNRSWFNYIVNNSKSTNYADAKEYAKLREELEKNGEQQ